MVMVCLYLNLFMATFVPSFVPPLGINPLMLFHYECEQLRGYLDLNCETPFDISREVIEDKDGIFQKNTNRYQAMVQIRP